MLKTIVRIFLLGLSFGAGPCVASCGPLLLSYVAGTRKDIVRSGLTYLIFSLARIAAYIVLSVAVFFLGRFAEQRLLGGALYKIVLIAGGSFIIFIGILMVLGKSQAFKPWQFLYRHTLERDKKSAAFLGAIIGLLPCGPLFAVLSLVGLVSRTWLQSAVYSISFGLGTILSPLFLLVILAGVIPRFMRDSEKIYRIFTVVCGLIIIALGVQLLLKF
jgi:sulfite exporter TauE/SafE